MRLFSIVFTILLPIEWLSSQTFSQEMIGALKKLPAEDAVLYLKTIERLEKRREEIGKIIHLTNEAFLPHSGKPFVFAEVPVKLTVLPGLLDLRGEAGNVFISRPELKSLYLEYRGSLDAQVSFFTLWLSSPKGSDEAVQKKMERSLEIAVERIKKHDEGLKAVRSGLGLPPND